ncbi:MAG: hypothetical protein R3F48_07895 [Candidatus Zixiibacteriota bacterium]
MEKNVKRLILLASLVLVIIPMVIFPDLLGLPLLTASTIYMLYEVVFYGVVLYFFNREVSLLTLLMGAALTLVYRLCLGAVFGATIMIMRDLNSSVSFSLAMARYLPGLLLHIAAAPFIMRPVYDSLVDNMGTSSRRRGRRPAREQIIISTETPAEDSSESFQQAMKPAMAHSDSAPLASTNFYHEGPTATGEEANVMEKAMHYIGESSSVKMALLVDDEGLTLARFNRSSEDYELWAPLALILEKDNRDIVNKYSRMGTPTKIDIATRQARLIFRRIDHVTLMVMADKTTDETIHIRIAQAVDMIRKYISERYSPALFARAEERYVSNS